MKDDSSQNHEVISETGADAPKEVSPDDTYPTPNFSPEAPESASPDTGLKASTPSSSPTPPETESIVSAPFSSVATTAGSKKFLMLGIGGLVLVGAYFIIQELNSGPTVEKTPSEKIQERSQADAQNLIKGARPISNAEEMPVPQPPKLPAALPVQPPQPPEPPPPPVPAIPQAPIFPQVGQPALPTAFSPESSPVPEVFASKEDDDARLKALEARRKAGIMVLGGGKGAGDEELTKAEKEQAKEKEKAKDKSAFLGFGEGAFGGGGLMKTSATQVKATQIGDLSSMIAQGKIIHAVLETAINTDLPGVLRAIIARDVYAESGNAVLIPKGSRVIGKYEAQVKSGQTRVAVIWNRLIRPDGVDIAIDSPGTDPLGRSGLAGFLDDKFFTKLGNAFLISFVVPAIVDKLFKVKGENDPVQTTTSTNALLGPTISTTKTTTFKQEQVKESADQFNQILKKSIEETFATTPTIFIDQGTEVNILVNRDLIFPPDTLGGNKVIR